MNISDQLISKFDATIEKDKPDVFLQLANLYDPITEARQFELLCVRMATRASKIVPFCESILEDHDMPIRLRVFAAVVAASAHRRNRRRYEAQDILRQVRDLEQDYPVLLHMHAVTLRGGEPAELRRGLIKAEQAHALLQPNAGASHVLAAFLADLAFIEDDEGNVSRMLERAIVLINDAISSEPRARFYYTRARIDRRLGNLESARSDLEIAIETEDSSAADYRHRITEYILESSLVDADRATQHFRRRAETAIEQSDAHITELEVRVDEAIQRFGNAQLQIISTLAFFASILGLIQFTALMLGKGHKLGQSLILVATLGVLLFGAVILGSLLLRKGMTAPTKIGSRRI